MISRFSRRAAVLVPVLLAACVSARPPAAPASHVPDFASKPYEPFSATAVVAIALDEWRLFGERVDDDPPGTRPPPPPEAKPERLPGLWERVGEYWWLGQDATSSEARWTGKHDETGREFPAGDDGAYAWSAAFVSYVMRIAGAGTRFPYSPAHHTYINIAWQMAHGQTRGWVVWAEPPEGYAPHVGDLICTSRDAPNPMRYADLPAGSFPAHCDIVVETAAGTLTVIGGNVDDAVTLKHVPVTPDGRLATPDGRVLDTRYPWFVVIRILYDTPVS